MLIKEVADLSAVKARFRARRAISAGIGSSASQKVWDTVNAVATSGKAPRSFVRRAAHGATSSARRLVTAGVHLTRAELVNAIVEAVNTSKVVAFKKGIARSEKATQALGKIMKNPAAYAAVGDNTIRSLMGHVTARPTRPRVRSWGVRTSSARR